MHILLPPSETKRSGGGAVWSAEALRDHAMLGEARERVRSALETLCADEDAAALALKLGVKSRGEIAHNLALAGSGAMPAVERYTGVIYDALDVLSLDGEARSWVEASVSVQSALFGLVSAGDLIPAYRLSAGSRLPALGAPLKRVWRDAHAGIDWSRLGWVLDLRSKDYAELAPLPEGAGASLEVVQRGPDGEVRALNHFNKAAKGDLVRRLASRGEPGGATADGPAALLAWAEREGLEMLAGDDGRSITLVTELGPAAGPSRRVTAEANLAVESAR
ncbi:MAG: YaaA family protein [Leucobacter sp.]